MPSQHPNDTHLEPRSADSTYGTTVGGRPRTWTGKLVSLAEWREASEWDRDGPRGKVWNGLLGKWE